MTDLFFSIDTNESKNLMVLSIRGTLTSESALQLVETAAKMQGDRQNYNRIYDLTEVEVEVGVSEFNNILAKAKAVVYDPNRIHKVAFVSPDSVVQVLLDIYKAHSQHFQFHEVDWFATRQQAVEWLNH